jgi:putative transposase
MIHHSVFYYQHHRREDAALRSRVREIAVTRVRYGHWRIYTLLRREGWRDNHKRVYRVYKEEGLNLRSKRPRRTKAAAHRLERPANNSLYKCWSMDFVSDALFDGRKFRALTIVDNYSRECLAIVPGQSLRGIDVVIALERIKAERGLVPERIQTDNGSEFISKEMDRWAYENKVTMDYSRPGKPTDNPFVESFNGSFRDECLNAHWFLSLEDAVMKIEAWKTEYNHYRPHSSLSDRTPAEFIEYCLKQKVDKQSLPGASSSDQMIFSTPETRSTKEEKLSVQMKKKQHKKRPDSTI